MKYDKTRWNDGGAPAINATHLNNIEDGIEQVNQLVSGEYIFENILSISEADKDKSYAGTGSTFIIPDLGRLNKAQFFSMQAKANAGSAAVTASIKFGTTTRIVGTFTVSESFELLSADIPWLGIPGGTTGISLSIVPTVSNSVTFKNPMIIYGTRLGGTISGYDLGEMTAMLQNHFPEMIIGEVISGAKYASALSFPVSPKEAQNLNLFSSISNESVISDYNSLLPGTYTMSATAPNAPGGGVACMAVVCGAVGSTQRAILAIKFSTGAVFSGRGANVVWRTIIGD